MIQESARSVRSLSSGLVGLDVALGGGFRLLRRLPNSKSESSIVLVRGGPGTGKSVLVQDLALRVASALAGDVLYMCVEVLPSEVRAQRVGFDHFREESVIDLAGAGQRPPSKDPCLLLGLPEMEPDEQGVPDVSEALLKMARMAVAAGYSPRVVVVDSLSDGYGLGSAVPRAVVDGICKIAVEQGWVLFLVEEAPTETLTNWAFAVDTVVSLRLATSDVGAQFRRELVVLKHRFGACEPGPHGLVISHGRLAVVPPLSSYGHATHIPLPRAAASRTLSVPSEGGETPPEWLKVHDNGGRCVLVEYPVGMSAEGARLTEQIGKSTPTGSFVSLWLEEDVPYPNDDGEQDIAPGGEGYRSTTLTPFVTGATWLEAALTGLCAFQASGGQAVVRIRIGPVEKLGTYAHGDDIRLAVSTLTSILFRHGHVVVLFGHGVGPTIRSAIVTDEWVLNASGTPAKLTVKAHGHLADKTVDFVPKMD